MKTTNLRKLITTIIILSVITGLAQADRQQLQEKLSKNVKFQIDDATIAEALTIIGPAADVKIVLSDEAVWKLPYGAATRLSVTLEGPLADSLTGMLNAFFMRYVVGDEEITIYPRQELEHILGRPTIKQITLLKRLYTDRLEEDLSDIVRRYDIVIVPIQHNGQLEELIERFVFDSPLLPTFAQILDSLGQWYISGTNLPETVTEVRIVDEYEFREAKLDQVVDVSFNGRADLILQRLAGWAGMELMIFNEEPSWLNKEITVNMQNVSIRQALLNIVNTVDGEIDLDVDNNTIEIGGPVHHDEEIADSDAPKSGGGSSDAYVGKISIPMEGGKYFLEFMLRESDLTQELKNLRDEKIKDIIGKAEGN